MLRMSVWALGINHNTAPLDLRGRFAFAVEQMGPALHGLRQTFAHHPEAAIISTCNRTEVYCASDRIDIAHTLDWLAQAGGVSSDALRQYTYTLQNDTVAHIPLHNQMLAWAMKKNVELVQRPDTRIDWRLIQVN